MPKYKSDDFADREVNEHARSFDDVVPDREGPMETGLVARGRTILQVEAKTTRIVGFTKDGQPINRPKYEELREGASFRAPQSEVRRLRELGYIFDPDKVASDEEAKKLDKNGNPVVDSGGVGFARAGRE